MKKITPFIVLLLIGKFHPSFGQSEKTPFSTITQMTTEQEFGKKYNPFISEFSTKIDGYDVLGSPFLYYGWYDGVINTPDGRQFNGYKVKYNIYTQTVSFLSGKDSLEANEEIKDFTLMLPNGNSTITSKFVNASQYQKEKAIFYYELLIDDKKGQLLKTNKKLIAELSNSSLPAYNGKKYFNLETSYYYYNKTSKKITKIKVNGSNISSVLGLNPVEETDLHLAAFDLSKEEDIIKLMNLYFQK
jgi:hypothetical protein